MNDSIQIREEMFEDNQPLRKGVKLERIAIATNILVVAQSDSSTKHLLLHNLDPEKLNQWYPFFISHNAPHAFASGRYADLLAEFNKAVDSNGFTEESRFCSGKKLIEQKLEVDDIGLCKQKILTDEYWIKFSVAQGIWTMYLFEYYKIDINSDLLVKILADPCFVLLPLQGSAAKLWVESGKYSGINIVDNIAALLKQDSIRDVLLA